MVTEITVTIGPDVMYLDGDMWGCKKRLEEIGFIFSGGRWTAKTTKDISIYDIIPILAKAGKTVKHPIQFLY